MPTYELNLKNFSFPLDLDESRSTFRFLTDIRYTDKDNNFQTLHAVAPGLDTYWECEKNNKKSPFFVRADDLSSKFDMAKVGAWDAMIIRFRANSIHSIQMKVIDIEKTGGLLDKIKDYAGSLIQSFLGVVKTKATGLVPAPISFAKDTLGEAVSDVESLALSTLSGMKGKDSLLLKWDRKGADLPAASGPFSVNEKGYKVDLHLEIIP